MDVNNNPTPMRRLSDRKSKPSMEDLVDHHRPVYWIQPTNQQQMHAIHTDSETNTSEFSELAKKANELSKGSSYIELNSNEAEIPIKAVKASSEAKALPDVLVEKEEASITHVKEKPMRIRIRLARLDPSDLPICSPTEDLQPLPISSSHVNGIDPGATPMEAGNEDSDEDNLPLSDLCKRVAHEPVHSHEPSPEEEKVVEQETLSVRELSVKKRSNRRKRLLMLPPSPPPSLLPIIRCRSCAQPATSGDLRWDGQFCSPDCIVKACRDAFSAHRRLQTFRTTAHNNFTHQTVS